MQGCPHICHHICSWQRHKGRECIERLMLKLTQQCANSICKYIYPCFKTLTQDCSNICIFSALQISLWLHKLCEWLTSEHWIYLIYTGWFFWLFRPKKWLSVRLHVNPFKKVLSVRFSNGSGTLSFLGRNSKKTKKKTTLYMIRSKMC